MAKHAGPTGFECPKCGLCKDIEEFYVSKAGRISGWCKHCTKTIRRNDVLAVVYADREKPALNRWGVSARAKLHEQAQHRRVVVIDVPRQRVYEWPRFRKNQGRDIDLWWQEIADGLQVESVDKSSRKKAEDEASS